MRACIFHPSLALTSCLLMQSAFESVLVRIETWLEPPVFQNSPRWRHSRHWKGPGFRTQDETAEAGGANVGDMTPLPTPAGRKCCLHKTTTLPTRVEDTGLTQLQLCDPSAPSFLSRQREPGVAEGKHWHHRTPWALSGTPPGTRPPFFCCTSTLLRAPSSILFLGPDPFHPSRSSPPPPPHHFTTASPFPPLRLFSGRSPFSSYFLPFPPLRTRLRSRLETSIRSLRTGSLPYLGVEAALMGTYHLSVPWWLWIGLPTAFLLGDKMPILSSRHAHPSPSPIPSTLLAYAVCRSCPRVQLLRRLPFVARSCADCVNTLADSNVLSHRTSLPLKSQVIRDFRSSFEASRTLQEFESRAAFPPRPLSLWPLTSKVPTATLIPRRRR